MNFSKDEISFAISNLKDQLDNPKSPFHLFNYQPDLSWFMNQGTKNQLVKEKKTELIFLGTSIFFLFNNHYGQETPLLRKKDLQDLYKDLKGDDSLIDSINEPELILFLKEFFFQNSSLSKSEIKTALIILSTIFLAFKESINKNVIT